jgi:hypothetical protein
MGHEAVTCAVSREPSLQYLPSSDGLFRLANIYVKPSLIFLARRGSPVWTLLGSTGATEEVP